MFKMGQIGSLRRNKSSRPIHKLMGHASKQMVYEVHGNYVEGLENDGERIFEYYGRDFVFTQKKQIPDTVCLQCRGQDVFQNQLVAGPFLLFKSLGSIRGVPFTL